MKKKLVVVNIIVIVLILNGCTQKKNIENNSALDEKAYSTIDNFFKLVSSGDTSALINLLKENENINLTDSLTTDLQNKFNFINQNSGTFISDTLLKKKVLNNDIGVYSYLVKYEKKFYRFVFVFYNNGKQVKIFRFSFDETIDIELEESIKLYVN